MVIDFHLHVGDFRMTGREDRVPMTWENQLARLDEEGIDKAVFLPVYNASPEGCPFPMIYQERCSVRDQVVDAGRYPDRIIPFGNMDPRWGPNRPDTDFGPILDWFQEHGCRGVGEITANVPFDDPRNVNMFRQLGERGMLVTIESAVFGPGHYGYQDDPGLPRLERLLQQAPDTVVIGHGPGFWANIAVVSTVEEMSGYPQGPVAREGAVARLLREYPNLYADTSAQSGWNALTRDPEHGIRFLEEFQDKILFGTDVCFADEQGRMPQLGWLKELRGEGRLSETAFEKIVSGNGLRLLGMG
ncbi:MAG: amidohydrolase family protein [Anaerolineae bacterium]|nr:amidohydrolase family protein [Anaerolineae bacterium]